jgi:Gas vesicle synthesis protein GvpL/GvpF
VDDEVTQDAVLKHAEVVEQLLGLSRAVLPARFDRPLADDAELNAAVSASARELERGLSRVRGCVELGLRIVAPLAEPVPKGDSGAEYMHARLAGERRRRRQLDELDAPLARLSEATAPTGSSGGDAFVTSYLVAAQNVPAFREAVDALQEAHPELTIVCTGPWAPFSFATVEAAA